MKPLNRLDERTRQFIEERRARGYFKESLDHFSDLEDVLRELIDRLLPGVPRQIDLACFVDEHADKSLGRGDRLPGLPPEAELFRSGLQALRNKRFMELSAEERDQLIGAIRRGDKDDELGFQAKEFVDRLLNKALAGYLAHPEIWERIGLNGPAYPEGYSWIGKAEVAARHRKAAGADRL